MSGNSQDTSEVYNYFLELSKPTEEDLNRVFTEEELKELCLKHKCKVNIWRWNVVDDYRNLFTQSGRYQKWSERQRLRMLAKAVNKIKPGLYTEEEIRETREEEWKFQLKENILSLNFWKRRGIQSEAALTQSDDVDSEVRSQFEVNTETINTDELLTVTQRQELENTPVTCINNEEIQLQIEVNKESEIVKKLRKSEIYESRQKRKSSTEFTTAIENNVIEDEFQEVYSSNDSDDSLETIKLNDRQTKKSREILESDEVAPEIENMYDINTMSMTVESQMSTQSQDLRTLQSQDVNPPHYDNFRNTIPLTSTQSQSNGSEEIIVT